MKRIMTAIITFVFLLASIQCCSFIAYADSIVPSGLPKVYPLSIEESETLGIKAAPQACFTSFASENGEEGLVCYLVGKVCETKDVDAGPGVIHMFTLQTEFGYASILDTYTFMMETYPESETMSFAEPESDYSFPEDGDFVKVVGIYSGYSETEKMPTFHYGTPSVMMATYHPEEDKPEPTPAVERLTSGQSNALRKAYQYLKIMPFSYIGLIEQLEHDAFDHDDAVYAADHCKADWNEQAAKKAEKYLDIMGFSRDGLISQLQHDGFTYDQAAYGADQNGL